MNQFVNLIEYADAFPYNCPHCGCYVKQRKRGLCAECYAPIEIFRFGRGKKKHRMWVSHVGHANDIADHVEAKIREVRQNDNFVFTDRDLQVGLATTFLYKCAGEHDIAYFVVEAYFSYTVSASEGLWPKPRDIDNVGQLMIKGGSFDNALRWARGQAHAERAEPIEQLATNFAELAYVGAK